MENEFQQFEEDLKQMLEVSRCGKHCICVSNFNKISIFLQLYFEYMRIYMSQLQNMQEMSKRLKNFLEDEWAFTKQQGAHVRGGEADGGQRFW